uniref:Laccase 1 isoform S n=1 Tax=Nephotettix cincticeps TaxID=94400 RepID=D5MRE1_NEPCI|nr:laccase 1 isoform S [Nephotettix cincticeps]
MLRTTRSWWVVVWLLMLGSAIAEDDPHYQLPSVDQHPCNRACVEGEHMTCYYKFTIEKYFAMGKACYDCPRNLTDCYREDCVSLDGKARPITTVNRRIPGPSVEVCLGDKIVVDVENMMADDSTSIHWHGHHQVRSPYMDGVPFVTQCPIQPLSVFRYTMHADNQGTLFWHAHTGVQKADGLFGAFIVRVPDSVNLHRDLYDDDLSEHIITVTDWTHQSSMDKYISHVQGRGTNKGDVFLVNGQGRFYNNTQRLTDTPLAVFKVQKGRRYRFRLINSGVMNCPTEMYIDKHNVTYISSDGYDFDPVVADSLVSYAGERWDFVLNANQEVGNYWIRFAGLMDCDQRFTSAHQVAVLHYEGAPELEPKEPVGYALHPKHTMQVNPLNVKITEPNTISVPNLLATNKTRDSLLLSEQPDIQVVLSYDFNPVDHPGYHKTPLYGFKQVNSTYKKYTPQFNYVTFKWPHSPLMSQYKDIPKDLYCSSQDLSSCKREYCECANIINVPLNSNVELILIDKGKTYNANHPFHLHGYAFRVVGMDRLGQNTKVHVVKSLDESGKLVRNLENPPYKDTVTVPDGGYTILRFHANNPGYWLFHCHIEYHVEEGMVVAFKIGEHEEFPPTPVNFPKCGDFLSDGTLPNKPDGADTATEKPTKSDKGPDDETKKNDEKPKETSNNMIFNLADLEEISNLDPEKMKNFMNIDPK